MSRLIPAALAITVIAFAGCGGPSAPPTDQSQAETADQATSDEQSEPVFEDDFETGETEDWAEGGDEVTDDPDSEAGGE